MPSLLLLLLLAAAGGGDAQEQPEQSAFNKTIFSESSIFHDLTYLQRNDDSPLDPVGNILPPTHLLIRGGGRLAGKYKPTDFLTFASDLYLIGSWDDSRGREGETFNAYLLDLYLDLSLGDFRFIAGRRNTVQSVGYFRYPLDFYESPSDFFIGAEEPRTQVETRYGPVLASLQGQWDIFGVTVEYVPKIPPISGISKRAGFRWVPPELSEIAWHTNEWHQLIGRASLLVSNLNVAAAGSYSFDRDDGTREGLPALRAASTVTAGLSATYVVGEALELHVEASYRRDRRMPTAGGELYSFTSPFPATLSLPVWRDGQLDHLVKGLVGGQYTFGENAFFLDGWNIILEYYFQNEGWNRADWDAYFTQLRALHEFALIATGGGGPFQAQIQPVASAFGFTNLNLLNRNPVFWGRHYGFARLSRSDVGIKGLELSAYAVASLQDGSFTAGANALYQHVDSVKVRASFRVFSGALESEFGRLPYGLMGQLAIIVPL